MDLNIRNAPEELITRLKTVAAVNRMTLRDVCLHMLQQGLQRMDDLMDPQLTNPTLEIKAERATYPGITKEAWDWASGRRNHDPKTCKVYRCAMCALGKHA